MSTINEPTFAASILKITASENMVTEAELKLEDKSLQELLNEEEKSQEKNSE